MARVSVWTIRRQERLPCAGVIDGDFFSVVAAPHRRHVVRSTYACAPPLSNFSHASHLSISDQSHSHLGLLRDRPGCALRRLLSGSKELLTRGSLRQNPFSGLGGVVDLHPLQVHLQENPRLRLARSPKVVLRGPPRSRSGKSRPCGGRTSTSTRCRFCDVVVVLVCISIDVFAYITTWNGVDIENSSQS